MVGDEEGLPGTTVGQVASFPSVGPALGDPGVTEGQAVVGEEEGLPGVTVGLLEVGLTLGDPGVTVGPRVSCWFVTERTLTPG